MRLVWLGVWLLLGGCQAPLTVPSSPTPAASWVRLEGRPSVPWSRDLVVELESLRDAALRSPEGFRLVRELCAVGPRLTGSREAAQAVDLVARELAGLGLEVKREKVMAPCWKRGQESAQVVGSKTRLALTALGGSGATAPQGLQAEVAVIRSWEELASAPVQGRIVFFDVAFDETEAAEGGALQAYARAVPFRTRGPAEAARRGAVAALVRSVGGGNLPHTGETEFQAEPPIPAAALAVPDAQRLAQMCARGPVRLKLVLTPQNLPPVESCNLVADLPGSREPDSLVLVTAHVDSWDLGTGAADNAAGVAMAVETMRLVRQLKLKPDRTLRVVIWMSEELGQAGAQAYARDHQAELGRHFAAVENDLGCGPPVRIDGQVSESTLDLLQELPRLLGSLGVARLRAARGTRIDLIPLAQAGVPCFSPIQDTRSFFDFHHTRDDVLERVDPANLQKNCAVTAVLAYALTRLP